MRPYFFGPPGQQLFGIYNPPRHPESASHGVVIAYPWGHEYTNSLRVFKVLANRLAEMGYHVLRFDYFGTGDSAGAAEAFSLRRSREDLERAIAELRNGYGVETLSLVGLRLGASIAALVGGQGGAVHRMILWEPIASGPDYIDYLRRLHAAYLEREFGHTTRDTGGEILGCPFREELADELRSLDLRSIEETPADEIVVMSRPSSVAAGAVETRLRALGANVATTDVAVDDFWANAVAVNSAAVPQEALRTVLGFMRATR